VRLVAPDGAQVGIKPLPEALNMARELGLDLVEVADKANPPVCRIMDYGKYKYETAQRAKESRKKSTNVIVKEMKYRPKIGAADFNTKTRRVEGFLAEGHKVKVTIMFRGRETQHPELGRKILDHVAEDVINTGCVEVYPKLDGRNMTMVLAPDKKAQAAFIAEKKRAAEEAATGSSGSPAPTPVDDASVSQPVPEPAVEAEVVPTASDEVVEAIDEIVVDEVVADTSGDDTVEA
jgi:translation initiation factor IF-3